MRKGVVWVLLWIIFMLAAFWGAFILSIRLYVEPAYEYISTEKIEERIADLERQLAERDERIEQLEDQIARYRSLD